MSRMLHRALAALLALPLAATVGTATAAAEEITVPGCYGVSVVVCDPTVQYGAGVETYTTVIPVCAGTCEDVRVTLVRPAAGEPLSLCVSYEDRLGAVRRQCAEVPEDLLEESVVERVREVAGAWTPTLQDAADLLVAVLDLVRG